MSQVDIHKGRWSKLAWPASTLAAFALGALGTGLIAQFFRTDPPELPWLSKRLRDMLGIRFEDVAEIHFDVKLDALVSSGEHKRYEERRYVWKLTPEDFRTSPETSTAKENRRREECRLAVTSLLEAAPISTQGATEGAGTITLVMRDGKRYQVWWDVMGYLAWIDEHEKHWSFVFDAPLIRGVLMGWGTEVK
ncbi:MAG TPA: hypothetical protein PKD86_03890 [Gemmatales bacterium]|nr:hypothetical protein [Gemmatales bacterium]